MKRVLSYISLLTMVMLTACESPESPSAIPEDEMTVTFRVAAREDALSSRAGSDGFSEGESLENFIDVEGGDFRILFLDDSNRVICRFVPSSLNASDNALFREYELSGKVPQAIRPLSSFKVAVFANWTTYPDNLLDSPTHLDEICETTASTFNRFDSFILSDGKDESPKQLIPFYGIKQFSGISFDDGNAEASPINLGGILMLRAVAKVEVEMATEQNYEVSSLQIHGVNRQGFCAPKRVYSESDYFHNYSWEQDFRQQLHIPGDDNDASAMSTELNLLNDRIRDLSNPSAPIYDRWIAYLPEFRNVSDETHIVAMEGRCHLALTATMPGGATKTFTIEFAEYDAEGYPRDDVRYDLWRNNIYRFSISALDEGVVLKLNVLDWNGRRHPQLYY